MEMTLKEYAVKALQELPAEASMEEVMKQLYFFHKLQIGVKQADRGVKVSQEEAKQRMKKWLE